MHGDIRSNFTQSRSDAGEQERILCATAAENDLVRKTGEMQPIIQGDAARGKIGQSCQQVAQGQLATESLPQERFTE